MSWETRKGRRYFYNSVRDGGKIRKVYVGCGDAGRAAELALDMRREREQLVDVGHSNIRKTRRDRRRIGPRIICGVVRPIRSEDGCTGGSQDRSQTRRFRYDSCYL